MNDMISYQEKLVSINRSNKWAEHGSIFMTNFWSRWAQNIFFEGYKRKLRILFRNSPSFLKINDQDFDVPFQEKTHSLSKRDIRQGIKSKRSLLSGEGVRNPCLVKNGKYPPYPPCNVKAVSDCYWTYMEQSVKMREKSNKLNTRDETLF